jgi:arylformamidase
MEDYVAISPDAARYLASSRLRSVGIDGPSVGPYNSNGAETHQILLSAGIWLIELLDLSRVPAGPCDLICLPLRIVGGDGAPARAILMPLRKRKLAVKRKTRRDEARKPHPPIQIRQTFQPFSCISDQ